MKKLLTLLTILALCLAMFPCAYAGETRTGEATGFGGNLAVEVEVDGEKILSVKITEEHETEGVGSLAVESLPDKIVAAGSIDVDSVTGATITSEAIKEAVKNAVYGRETISVEDTQADVVVIGAGGAGLTAALRAAENGASVIVLEKQGHFGGNTAMTGLKFGCSNSSVHKAEGKTQTVEDHWNFYRAKASATQTYADPEAAHILAENSGPAADWLMSLGIEFSGTSGNWMLLSNDSIGRQAIDRLSAEGEKLGVDYRLENRATSILTEDGKITGVTVSTKDGDYTISCSSVVVATGGYAYCDELITRYIPQWNGYPRRSSPALTGDGHLMAEAVGAAFRDMEVIKGNCFMHIDDEGNVVYLGSLNNAGAILVNYEGWRFAAEDNHYLAGVTMRAQTAGEGFFIFGQSAVDANADLSDYIAKGYAVSAASINELAEKTGIFAPQLESTVEKYITMCKDGKDTDFNRGKLTNCFENEPAYYAIKMTAALQGTFGGIATDTEAQVLTQDGTPIPGLYAAGECAGDGLRGLNPMTTNIVFGGIAGTNAANYAKK